ncbi:MAG: 3-deoxy-D-manno-octulosonic acid transferase [Epsilonproteobacteria bacterium]|nr:MAG: 3-deoxy-D-manno-octulosonic acid transferase [Campylobacterota bacterium]
MKPFTVLYFFVSVLLYLLALPLLLWLSFKSKYRQSIPSRFFLKNNAPFEREGIWFHVCSLGEARAIKPLLQRLENEQINITTITETGQNEAKKYRADVRYLPYEMFLPLWIGAQPVLVVLEAEFWYMLFAVARVKGARVILLNARITERSFPKYRRFGWFYRKLFDRVEKIFCQSEADKERFELLGAKNIEVTGNIKLAQEIMATAHYEKPDREVVVAASTHEGEEQVILESFLQYRQTSGAQLIVVPRHPERFDTVWTLIQKRVSGEMKCSRWSEQQNLDADIVLVDAMGELNNIYAISDIAILGGAFKEDVGGHNPLEPAHFGCKIITGKHGFAQRELLKYVHNLQEVETDDILTALQVAKTMSGSFVDETIKLDRVIEYIRK